MLNFAKLSLITLLSLTTVVMASGKDVIVSFQKSTSEEDRNNAVKELEGKGCTIVKDNNKHSSIMPFVVVNVNEDNFAGIQSSFSGHSAIKHIEEDQVMTTQ